MTTPESLEMMMISRREEPKLLLAGVRMAIIDEIHAFAGDDRGTHLIAVVERLGQMLGREIQRVGLSATVGYPAAILEWMAGHCEGSKRVVQIPAATVNAEVMLGTGHGPPRRSRIPRLRWRLSYHWG
jgi:ATP-dependent Lhr-like helicase